MTSLQLWAGRMRKDAADALGYGCTGLMGIHWRTRAIGPNVAALAAAAWDQSWNRGESPVPAGRTASIQGGPPRSLPVDDFYADWALAQFGSEVAKRAGASFAKIDGQMPRPTDWTSGPGGIKPDPRPWDSVAKHYTFIDELSALRPLIKGAGNLQRFEYWEHQFRYMNAAAMASCRWHQFNEVMAKVKRAANDDERKRLVRELALPTYKELLAAVSDLHRHLLAAVTTPGELGTVANWQQHNMPDLVFKTGQELAEALGDRPAGRCPAAAGLRRKATDLRSDCPHVPCRG